MLGDKIADLAAIGIEVKLLILENGCEDNFALNYELEPFIELIAPTNEGDLGGLEDYLNRLSATDFKPRNSLNDIKMLINDGGVDSANGRRLIGCLKSTNSDVIVTDNELLLRLRYILKLSPDRIWIISPGELVELVDVIAHGHNYFEIDGLSVAPDLYYVNAASEGRKYFEKYSELEGLIVTGKMRERLRNALLNRLPAILHTRDLLIFYDLQTDYTYRTDPEWSSLYHLSYFHSIFYFQIWGLLDQLTLIVNDAAGIGHKERYCGIKNDDFWKAARKKVPSLCCFIKLDENAEWIGRIADIRHLASHELHPIITPLLNENSKSFNMSEEEVAETILRDDPTINDLPEEMRKMSLALRIGVWRSENAEVLLPKAMAGGNRNPDRIYLPTIDIQEDMDKILEVLDEFILAIEECIG
jgi:hypothetical protein